MTIQAAMTPGTTLTFENIEQPISEWALDYGITPEIIIARLRRGLSVEQAITEPMVVVRPGQKLADTSASCPSRGPRSRGPHPRGPHNSRMITFNGRTMSVRGWAEELGVSYGSLRGRFDRGWPIERALTEPVMHGRQRGEVINFPIFPGDRRG